MEESKKSQGNKSHQIKKWWKWKLSEILKIRGRFFLFWQNLINEAATAEKPYFDNVHYVHNKSCIFSSGAPQINKYTFFSRIWNSIFHCPIGGGGVQKWARKAVLRGVWNKIFAHLTRSTTLFQFLCTPLIKGHATVDKSYKGAIIHLVDAVFGTGLDAVFGLCNFMFCRARGRRSKHSIAQAKDSIKSFAKDSIYKRYDSSITKFDNCIYHTNLTPPPSTHTNTLATSPPPF